jgi:hypothetical protein
LQSWFEVGRFGEQNEGARGNERSRRRLRIRAYKRPAEPCLSAIKGVASAESLKTPNRGALPSR